VLVPPADARAALLRAVERHALERPDEPAVVDIGSGGERATTWAGLARGCRAVSTYVSRMARGDGPVVLRTPNGSEFATLFLGILGAGREAFPVPVSAGPAEVFRAAGSSGAALIIADGLDAAHETQGRPLVRPEDAIAGCGEKEWTASGAGAGVLLHSSGTTGLPKIVRRSAEALDAVALAVREAAALTRDDRVLGAVPMSHSYGLENVLLGPVLAGATIIAIPLLDAGFVDAALAHRCTVFPAVPFLIEMLSTCTRRQESWLRLVYSAGAALPSRVEEGFRRSFGMRVGQLYGATEVGSVTFEDPSAPWFDAGCAGAPMRGCEILVSDADSASAERPAPAGVEGHVLVRSASMLSGYMDAPDPCVGGFFPTGDLGSIDDRGRLRITGRLKLMIDVGGAKVNPLEVERALCSCPGVAECAVVPVRASDTVSRLCAVVVRTPDDPADEARLRAFARERLAAFKVPRLYEFRERLPRSATGKVLRASIEVDS